MELPEVAQTVQAAWAEAFGRGDWPAVAALYDTDVAFYGSTATLHTDQAGVLEYFQGLPPIFIRAEYATPQILALGDGLFAASGAVVFVVRHAGGEQRRPYRMSQVFRRTAAGWRIALHHASPSPS